MITLKVEVANRFGNVIEIKASRPQDDFRGYHAVTVRNRMNNFVMGEPDTYDNPTWNMASCQGSSMEDTELVLMVMQAALTVQRLLGESPAEPYAVIELAAAHLMGMDILVAEIGAPEGQLA